MREDVNRDAANVQEDEMGECPANSMSQCSQGIPPRQEDCEWVPLLWVHTSFILSCSRTRGRAVVTMGFFNAG